MVARRGGKCARCGWIPRTELEQVALDFHHLDASSKAFDLSGAKIASLNRRAEIQAEADKCILLCAICHRIHHAEANDLKR